MNDIVERLRWCPEYGGWSDAVVLMPEAATAIERLREELADVRADAALLREQVASLQASREEMP